MNSRSCIATALLTVWFVSLPAFAGDPILRIATDAPYKPMEFRAPDGRLEGFDIDLGNALCQQIGRRCQWIVQAWDGIVPGLMARKYDAIMSSMAITPARQRVLIFSEPYIRLRAAWFVPAASSLRQFTSATLKNAHIGVQRGTIQDRYATDHFKTVADIKRYRTADDMAVDMAAGRLDAMLVTEIVGRQMLESQKDRRYRRLPAPDLSQALGIAFRPSEASLVKQMNRALARLKADGSYARLHKRWFAPAGSGG